jgi:hypothetical protein
LNFAASSTSAWVSPLTLMGVDHRLGVAPAERELGVMALTLTDGAGGDHPIEPGSWGRSASSPSLEASERPRGRGCRSALPDPWIKRFCPHPRQAEAAGHPLPVASAAARNQAEMLGSALGTLSRRMRRSKLAKQPSLTWTPETEPALMRASLPARIGQEKPHESQTPQPRADHPQVADR